MIRKYAKYAGYGALWVLIIAVVVWAQLRTSEHIDTTTVSNIRIDVEQAGERTFVDSRALEEWIGTKGLSPVGSTLSKADIAQLESAVSEHTAIAEANVYLTYDGEVAIDVVQHEPIARLRIDGYDAYITADGCIVRAADGYSLPVTVVTGGYKPIFGKKYTGYVGDVIRDSIATLDSYIAELEAQKIPHFEQLQDNNKALRLVTSQRMRQGMFMSDEEFEILNNDLKRRKSEARSNYRHRKQDIEAKISALERRQEETRNKQRLLKNEYDDFMSMVSFLTHISHNKFWSAEIVQVIASGGRGKSVELSFVPRSGRFTVELGTTEEYERKLATLSRFYENGLNNIGWDKYRHISLRYRGQVVCR